MTIAAIPRARRHERDTNRIEDLAVERDQSTTHGGGYCTPRPVRDRVVTPTSISRDGRLVARLPHECDALVDFVGYNEYMMYEAGAVPSANPSTTGDGLLLRAVDDGEHVVIALAGEIDLASAPRLHAALDRVLAQCDHDVVVDLGATSFVDVAGLRAIEDVVRSLRDAGLEPHVSLSPPVARVAAIVGSTVLDVPPPAEHR
jgi:anti-sigma B factor antagonist